MEGSVQLHAIGASLHGLRASLRSIILVLSKDYMGLPDNAEPVFKSKFMKHSPRHYFVFPKLGTS